MCGDLSGLPVEVLRYIEARSISFSVVFSSKGVTLHEIPSLVFSQREKFYGGENPFENVQEGIFGCDEWALEKSVLENSCLDDFIIYGANSPNVILKEFSRVVEEQGYFLEGDLEKTKIQGQHNFIFGNSDGIRSLEVYLTNNLFSYEKHDSFLTVYGREKP